MGEGDRREREKHNTMKSFLKPAIISSNTCHNLLHLVTWLRHYLVYLVSDANAHTFTHTQQKTRTTNSGKWMIKRHGDQRKKQRTIGLINWKPRCDATFVFMRVLHSFRREFQKKICELIITSSIRRKRAESLQKRSKNCRRKKYVQPYTSRHDVELKV